MSCIPKQSRKIKKSTFADTCELNFGYSSVFVPTISLFENKPYGAVKKVEFESNTLFRLFFFPPKETK